MVKPSAQTLTDRSPLTSISIGTPYHESLAERILHLYPKTHIFAPATAISTENTGGSSIIDRISVFQVRKIHLDTFPQYFPAPLVPAPGSYLYRSKNSAPERQFSASIFSIMTWSNPVIETPLSSVWYALKHTRTSDQSLHFFLEQCALQVAHYWVNPDITETHAAMPIIARISLFQARGIYLDNPLQYFPSPWVPAPSSAIYRSRNSAPERQFSAGFFSMKTLSNRTKETALSSVQYC
jgi:hypothetical protein